MLNLHGNVKCTCGHRVSIHSTELIPCVNFQPTERYIKKRKIKDALNRQLKLF